MCGLSLLQKLPSAPRAFADGHSDRGGGGAGGQNGAAEQASFLLLMASFCIIPFSGGRGDRGRAGGQEAAG